MSPVDREYERVNEHHRSKVTEELRSSRIILSLIVLFEVLLSTWIIHKWGFNPKSVLLLGAFALVGVLAGYSLDERTRYIMFFLEIFVNRKFWLIWSGEIIVLNKRPTDDDYTQMPSKSFVRTDEHRVLIFRSKRDAVQLRLIVE